MAFLLCLYIIGPRSWPWTVSVDGQIQPFISRESEPRHMTSEHKQDRLVVDRNVTAPTKRSKISFNSFCSLTFWSRGQSISQIVRVTWNGSWTLHRAVVAMSYTWADTRQCGGDVRDDGAVKDDVRVKLEILV